MSLPICANQEPDLRSPASSTETFTDVNHVNGLLHLATTTAAAGSGSSSSGGRPGPPLASWAAELSASFAIIAEQLQNASRTMATAGAGASTDLLPRLDAVEQAQERLAVELAALRSLHAGKSRALAPNESLIVPDVVSSSSVSSADLERRLADLERRLADTLNSQRLEQERLYARLFNSRATVSKMPILALPTTTGKIPPNHPNSKGEFEHLTKERYEGLLKAYDQPIPGDTAAKREALRVFLGLPPA